MPRPTPAADLVEIAMALVAGGESYYVEFKTAWNYTPHGRQPRELKDVATDIAEAAVAFANSDGGDVLVGVEDSGAITGIPWQGDELLYLLQAARERVLEVDLGVKVHEVEVAGAHVLLFRVPDFPLEPVATVTGRCLWRRGTADHVGPGRAQGCAPLAQSDRDAGPARPGLDPGSGRRHATDLWVDAAGGVRQGSSTRPERGAGSLARAC